MNTLYIILQYNNIKIYKYIYLSHIYLTNISPCEGVQDPAEQDHGGLGREDNRL